MLDIINNYESSRVKSSNKNFSVKSSTFGNTSNVPPDIGISPQDFKTEFKKPDTNTLKKIVQLIVDCEVHERPIPPHEEIMRKCGCTREESEWVALFYDYAQNLAGIWVDDEMFKLYEAVRRSALYNMFDPRAIEATGLSHGAYRYVMSNYNNMRKAFGKPKPLDRTYDYDDYKGPMRRPGKY